MKSVEKVNQINKSIPSFLNESFTTLLQLGSFELHNNAKKLIFKTFQCDSVVYDHRFSKDVWRVFGISNLSVEVQTEIWIIVDLLVTQHNVCPTLTRCS